MKNGPVPSTKHTPSQTHNRVKPIIQELTRKVKRGQYEEVQSLRDHAQGVEVVPRGCEQLCRSPAAAFSECLHRAWNSAKAEPINAQRIEEAQQAAGITEPVNTWAGWKAAGYMVEHGAKALFQAVLIHSSRGDGQTYRASFFGASQVQPLEAL